MALARKRLYYAIITVLDLVISWKAGGV